MATRSSRRRAPAATRIVLVRHGRTATTGTVLPGRTPGLHLSAEGVAQAEATAAKVVGLAPAAVYSSPLERARQTAAPIAAACGVRVRSARGLLECDFGDWTGAKLSALRKRPEWSHVQHSPSTFRFPGGESFAEMQLRIWNELERLASLHPDDTVVAVSHADPIKSVLALAGGAPLDALQRFVVSTCSVSILSVGHGSPLVLCANSPGGELGGVEVS